METHSSILAWKISWTEEPGGLQSLESQRVGHNRVTEHRAQHNIITGRNMLTFLNFNRPLFWINFTLTAFRLYKRQSLSYSVLQLMS